MKFNNLLEIITKNYHKNQENKLSFYNRESGSFVSISIKDFSSKVLNLAVFLKSIAIDKGDKVAIFMQPSPFWLMADFAISSFGAVSVPIFSNISFTNFNFQIKDSEADVVFLENLSIIENKNFNFQNISRIIVKNKILDDANLITANKGLGQQIYYLDDILNNRNNTEKTLESLSKDVNQNDLATIVYTSGTTAMPKGVMITHKNFLSQIESLEKIFDINSEDTAISFLPMAHIFERMVVFFYLSKNVSVCFVNDVKNLVNSLQIVKPNLLTVVPRMLEKIMIKIHNSGSSKTLLLRFLFNLAYSYANKEWSESRKNSIYYKIFNILVYKKLRAIFGGNIKMIICGGASLDKKIENFYWNIGLKVFVGYGLTETSPVLTVNSPNNHCFGSVGVAIPSVSLWIAEDGELLAKGENIFLGYYRNQDSTKKAFTDDGMFKTGDFASIDSNGFVSIIGRKKDVYKTSNGKFVRPNLIEQLVKNHITFADEVVVVAESRQFVLAIIFVDEENLDILKNKHILSIDKQDIVKPGKELENELYHKIEAMNQNLDRCEQVKKIIIVAKSLSVDNGYLTPSLKVRKNFVFEQYSKIIEEIYLSEGEK